MAENFKITGDKEVIANLKKLEKKHPQEFARGLFVVANEIMTLSKREFVPVDTGALRSSGRVEKPIINRRGIGVQLVYGGNAAPYAWHVHENHRSQSKYLERPLQEAAKDFANKLTAVVKL